MTQSNLKTQNSPPPIRLFVTGGTLDKQYQETTGELMFPSTHLPILLQEANVSLPIETTVLMQKDSLEISEDERTQICQACIDTPQQKIVITHGTDTMVNTATALSRTPELNNKTIILTGAMRPFMLGHSDASFNLGSALTAVQLTKAGVYIAMNGQLFQANQVQKNRELGLFTEL